MPFVGRREELALLDLLWSSAAKGNTHVVSVVGEPGVGKSRLLDELRPSGDPIDIRIACGGERAFGPFVELVERILGDDPPKDAEELCARAGELGVEREHALLVGSFLGFGGAPPVVRMADEQRGQQIFNGFWQFVVAVCGSRPALIALDDVHWADESSRDLLDFLLERLAGLPLMLLLCYRPSVSVMSVRSSSGSRCSASVVKPTRSAKSTVTMRRSPAIAATAAAAGAGTAASSILVPQDVQKAASAGKDAPHEGQLRSSDAPQLAQKRESGGFS